MASKSVLVRQKAHLDKRPLGRSHLDTNFMKSVILTLISLFATVSSISLILFVSLSSQQPTTTTTDVTPTIAPTSQHNTAANQESWVFKHDEQEKNTNFWMNQGRLAIQEALRYEPIKERAKNAIVFIGDGMSLTTITAARIQYGQLMNKSGEEEQLPFEKLPNVALLKTYNVDQQIPDSAATATAILSGVKTNYYTVGVNANVKLNETNCQRIEQNKVNSILKQAMDAGKSTGIVTNTRITHATPAAGYAHTSNRRWECDGLMPSSMRGGPCKDIARQLIEDDPGRRLNVIMGGGRRCFFGPQLQDPGPTGHNGLRKDGLNLIDSWIDHRRSHNQTNFAFVNMTKDLRSVDMERTDYLLGLFAYSHMNYEELRDQSGEGEPSLSEMTLTAIKLLSKNPKGFVLLVEGGRIDHAHHENVAGVALRETISFAWTIEQALSEVNKRDTLVAVTADHAHALTINGMAPRGNPILGVGRYRENSSQIPYTTLIYGNGPGHQSPRRDPSQAPNSTDSPYYVQYAAVHQEEAFHDGSDVGVFAIGPYAHLFQGIQEQTYMAHVFSYALCMTPYAHQAHCAESATRIRADQTKLVNGPHLSWIFGRSDSSSSSSQSSHLNGQLTLVIGLISSTVIIWSINRFSISF